MSSRTRWAATVRMLSQCVSAPHPSLITLGHDLGGGLGPEILLLAGPASAEDLARLTAVLELLPRVGRASVRTVYTALYKSDCIGHSRRMESSVFTPGAGHQPPFMAGRDQLLRDWRLGLAGTAAQGRLRARDVLLVGPRGVGKTALLGAFASIARESGFEVVNLQATAGRAGLVEGLLQRAADRQAQGSGAWSRARRSFDRVESVSLGALGVSVDVGRTVAGGPRHVDAGTLAQALVTLAEEVRAEAPGGGVLITVDELQVASGEDLVLLAAMLHRLNVDHSQAAVLFAGTGLPHTPSVLTEAGVTHSDRLFLLENIPVTLSRDDAMLAILEPARQAGVVWESQAAEAVVQASGGYPAHLQLFAHNAWQASPASSTISLQSAEQGLAQTVLEIERRTLGPRWDRLTDRQMEYLAALTVLGGTSGSGRLAAALGRTSSELSWIRDQLLKDGDIYAPRRGTVALTVPLFAPYVLSRYEHDRLEAELPLLDVAQMRRNAELRPRDAGQQSLPDLASPPRSSPLARPQQQEPPPHAHGR